MSLFNSQPLSKSALDALEMEKGPEKVNKGRLEGPCNANCRVGWLLLVNVLMPRRLYLSISSSLIFGVHLSKCHRANARNLRSFSLPTLVAETWVLPKRTTLALILKKSAQKSGTQEERCVPGENARLCGIISNLSS